MSTLVVETVPNWKFPEIELPESMRITPAAFKELCSRNKDIHAELSSDGNLIIMAPTGGNSGWRNSEISADLSLWIRERHNGIAFDSSTVFHLPNGAMRGPDASWVKSDRWEALTAEEQDGFPPLCPDFVIELRSKTNRLAPLQAKMDEFIANGAMLGFLIDPIDGCAHIYRPGAAPQILIKPDFLSGDPELPGLMIDLTRIW